MARKFHAVLVLGAVLTWVTPVRAGERYMCVGSSGTFEATYDAVSRDYVCDGFNSYQKVEMNHFYTKCYDPLTRKWVGGKGCGSNEPTGFTKRYQTSYERYLSQGVKSQCTLPDGTTQSGFTERECRKSHGKFASKDDLGDKKVNEYRSSYAKANATPAPNVAPAENKDGKDSSLEKNVNVAQNEEAQKKFNEGVQSKLDRNQLYKTQEAKHKAVETADSDLNKSNGSLAANKAKLRIARQGLNELEYGSGPPPTEQQLIDQRKVVDQAKEDTKKAREAAREDRKDLRQAKRDAREADRDARDAAGVDQIRQKNEGDNYGGNYGGEDVGTSETIRAAAMQVSGASDMVGNQKVATASQDREAALRQQGTTNINLEQTNEARKEVAKEAKNALITGGVIDMALGLYQGFRASQHLKSINQVESTAATANKEIDSEETVAKISGALSKIPSTKKLQELEEDRKNVLKNSSEEIEAQSNAALAQGMAAAAMAYKGATKFQSAAAISAIEAQASANAHQYGFGMGGGITVGGGQDGVNALSPVQSAVTTEEEGKKDDLAQNSPINPNDPNQVPEGPPAAAFVNQDPSAGGGGAGGGPATAGGTSADKSAMEAGAQGPAAVTKAGSYAAVAGGNGYKSRNAGGAAKAGIDTGFADLLKKFLPGAEPEKKKSPGELQFGDRSPASSQTAVIGRNKNIFEEISKRYQKKSAEGSVF